jgi:threonine dehydratase
MPISLEDVLAARLHVSAWLPATPCASSPWLDRVTGAHVRLKLESAQPSGSFKDRGACSRLAILTENERARGVIAASAGNHAQAVALHAKRLGIHAVIVMPETTPLIKVENTRAHGAEVVLAGATYDAAYEEAKRIEADRNLVYVHAFDDAAVIAGQGTMALEILEQMPELDVLVVPIGGGGMIAGVARVVQSLRPGVRVFGAQAALVPSMHAALESGAPLAVEGAQTLADGIAVRRVATQTFEVVRECVEGVVLVTEDEIAAGILFLLERQKSLAEGAGAAAVAALLANKIPDLAGRHVCAIVSGGNIDVTVLGKVVDRGLVGEGRLVRLHVRVHDRPGALAEIASIFAKLKANVVEIQHERAFSHSLFCDVEVYVTLETRGPEHVTELRAALQGIAHEVREVS